MASLSDAMPTNLSSACAAISRLLDSDPYDSEVGALRQARRDVMDKYNIFRLIAGHLDQMDFDIPRADGVTLRPIGAVAGFPNVINHTLVWPFWKAVARLSRLS